MKKSPISIWPIWAVIVGIAGILLIFGIENQKDQRRRIEPQIEEQFRNQSIQQSLEIKRKNPIGLSDIPKVKRGF